MRLKQLGATLALALICTLANAKDGYKITLIDKSADSATPTHNGIGEGKAVLYIEGWNGRSAIDSTFADKKGRYRFSGKKNLAPGEYTIEFGKYGLEFFISQNGYVNESFSVEPTPENKKRGIKGNGKAYKINHLKGTEENRLFSDFQNLVNYGWKEIGNSSRVESMIDSISAEVVEDNSNSLFARMLEGYSANPHYGTLFSDSRITSTRFGKKFLSQYFTSIEYNHTDSVIAGVDRIIGYANGKVKPYIAAEAFLHFEKPSVMGQESVAFHVAENYFNEQKLDYPYENLDFQIRTFIMLNGKSLIGMEAQELPMQDTAANGVSLKELIGQGEYTILYFYTDDCITCRVETPKLVDFVNGYNQGVINVYAVYTQDYVERWKKYINDNFNIYNPFVNWTNAADPQFESGFHLLYNVISTPQIYLIDNQGTIIGRDLSVKSLSELITKLKEKQNELHNFFSVFFANPKSVNTIRMAIDRFAAGCSNNNEIFREIISELYIYLKFSEDYRLKEGALYLADKYILAKEELWSKSYVSRIADEVVQMSKNKPEEIATTIEFKDLKGNSFTTDSFAGNYKVICLYNSNCNSCLPSIESLNSIKNDFKGKNIDFISADITQNEKIWRDFIANNQFDWVNLWIVNEDIHRDHNLGTLPLIYLLDKENRVIARHLNSETLREILENL